MGFFGSGDIFGYTGRGVLMRRRVFVQPFAPSPFSTGSFAFGAAFGGGDFRDDCDGRVSFVAGRDAAPAFTTSAHSLKGGLTLARSPGVLFPRLSWPLKRL